MHGQNHFKDYVLVSVHFKK